MKWLAAFFGLFILVVILLADLGKLGFLYSIYRFPNGDKLGHFILFGILTFLIDLSLFRSSAQGMLSTVIPNRRRVAVRIGLFVYAGPGQITDLF